MAGYSGTPLVKKLGIQEGATLYLVNAPEDYLQLVSPVPKGLTITPRLTNGIDIAHIFSTKETHLVKALNAILPKLKQDGSLWVSWPKKLAKVQTDITEDTIRRIALPMGLVDIKVCAVTEVWSGLKLVIRKENRKTEQPTKPFTGRARTARR